MKNAGEWISRNRRLSLVARRRGINSLHFILAARRGALKAVLRTFYNPEIASLSPSVAVARGVAYSSIQKRKQRRRARGAQRAPSSCPNGKSAETKFHAGREDTRREGGASETRNSMTRTKLIASISVRQPSKQTRKGTWNVERGFDSIRYDIDSTIPRGSPRGCAPVSYVSKCNQSAE